MRFGGSAHDGVPLVPASSTCGSYDFILTGMYKTYVVTDRKRSYGKVMFSQVFSQVFVGPWGYILACTWTWCVDRGCGQVGV